jgi:hypothetical protein
MAFPQWKPQNWRRWKEARCPRPTAPDRRPPAGRAATRGTLAGLLASAQSTGLIGKGEPAKMARQFLGLLWESLMVRLLLGGAATPAPA